MFRIRQNIIFSVMAHSALLAAALLIGGSSEIRKANIMTVLLSDEKESGSPEKQAAVPIVKQTALTMAAPMAAVKPVAKLSKVREIIPKQNTAPLAPVAPQSDTDRASVSESTGIEAPANSSQGSSSGPTPVSSQTSRNTSRETGAVSASHGQTDQASETGADASLKQRIRDALQANLVYPYIARKRGIEGTVLMEFRINGRGMPEGIRIVKGSSYSILDEAARETVAKTSPFPARDNIIEVPIRFSLRRD
ncbi:MAG: energy transducer TonB [Nitrospirota bacterium]|nr:energy transducer TonB [Nitrospirota bacterium]